MRKNIKNKSLNLNSETVRSLSEKDLRVAAGGSDFTGLYCPTQGKGTCAPGSACHNKQ